MATDPTKYVIGKGIVYFKLDGESAYRDLGNVAEFEFTPTIETLPHYSSRTGVKTKDLTVIIQKSGTVRIVMEEWIMENLRMAFLGGTIAENASSLDEFEIFAVNAISGALRFVGANEQGDKFQMDLNKVDFVPGSSINMISEEFAQLELTGEVAAVAGVFGKIINLDTVSS
jgi:hypothetical protein